MSPALLTLVRSADPIARELLAIQFPGRYHVFPRGHSAYDPMTGRLRSDLLPTTRPRPPSTRTDPRRVTSVSPLNPKRPGTAAHARFALWRVGMTVDDYYAAGGQRQDPDYDARRGYITLEMP